MSYMDKLANHLRRQPDYQNPRTDTLALLLASNAMGNHLSEAQRQQWAAVCERRGETAPVPSEKTHEPGNRKGIFTNNPRPF